MATLTLEPALLAYFNELKGHEGKKINKVLTHKEFMTYLLEVYQTTKGDFMVRKFAWDKINKK
ncbi:MAG: hypothetical protein KKG76_00790 [Euryarchaeota archaeon]|nr:hypothetical protein [Euryarchaeota archaeon]